MLDKAEFRELMLSLGDAGERMHPNFIDFFCRLTDTDGDGVISLPEFLRVHEQLREFGRHLRAPRRVPSEQVDLAKKSRLVGRAELRCPDAESTTVRAGTTEFTVETRYTKLERIGEGAYGVICLATDSESREQVAIKRVRPTEDQVQLRCCLRELAILRHFGRHAHDNLLGLRALLPPPGGHLAEWRHLYIVTPLMDTDLHQLIKSDQARDEA